LPSLPNGYGVTSVQQAPAGGFEELGAAGVVVVKVVAQFGVAAAAADTGPVENHTNPANANAASIAGPAVRGVPPSLLISTPHRTGISVSSDRSSPASNN
jgi:hypothetical protein